MGKCLRRSCRQRLSPAVEAAAYLTLRSGRRVPAAAGSGSGSPRRRHRRAERCCGQTGAASAARQRRGRRVLASQSQAGQEEPPSQDSSPIVFCNEDCRGDRCVAPHAGEAKRNHHESDAAVVEPRSVSLPPEAEIEAFLAAAELAERRRFLETYNYDIALDRPLEGRFNWLPVSA